MPSIDLNSDLGESFGRYTLGLDDQVIPLVSSVNVACGMHAGDPAVMRRTVKLAAEAPELARAVAAAVKDANLDLVLVGLANSELIRAGQAEGIRTAQEFFADRNYTDEGLLVSRKLPDAVIDDEDFAVARVVRAVKEGAIESASGKLITVKPDTICIHGDNVHALEFAGKIRTALTEAGVEVKPV